MNARRMFGKLAVLAATLVLLACTVGFSYTVANTPDTPGRKDLDHPQPHGRP